MADWMALLPDGHNIQLNSSLMYRIYSRISRKIYDKIMPQKLGGDLSAGHKIKTFFPGAKICNFLCTGNQ